MKYSIIIPVKNAITTLPSVLDTILPQTDNNYEVIISDNNSKDGTAEYIDSIISERIKVVHVEKDLLISEHFDLAQSYATGDWQFFLGGDDGLQPYFFELANILTKKADEGNISVIASKRAYYFFQGVADVYGSAHISYHAEKKISYKKSKYEIKKVFSNIELGYNHLPTMYVTSMWSKEFINKIRKIQNGKLVCMPITDAYLAAVALLNTKKYLYSEIPLSWVGTSSISVHRPPTVKKKIFISPQFGSYELKQLSLLFLAGLNIFSSYSKKKYFFSSKYFLYKYFSKLALSIPNTQKKILEEVIRRNNCSVVFIMYLSKFYSNKFIILVSVILKKINRRVYHMLHRKKYNCIELSKNQNDFLTYKEVNLLINKSVSNFIHFER